MAEVSLKISAEFAQAQKEFTKLGNVSEEAREQIEKFRKSFDPKEIDTFMAKNKLMSIAVQTTKGDLAGAKAEVKGLEKYLQKLQSEGLSPTSKEFEKLANQLVNSREKMNKLSDEAKKLKFDGMKKGADDSTLSMKSMVNAVGALGIGFGAYQIANKIFDIGKASIVAAANMEQQTVAFTTMLGSAAKAESLLASLQEFAATTPFNFNELTEASRKMIAFGFSTEEVIPKLRMVGDVSAGLSQPIGDMIYLFGQIKTQGKAMTQDLNQFANRGVPIFEEVAKAMNVPTNQVRKLAEEGKITYDVINKAFENMTGSGGKFGGLMEAQAKTLSGKWSNFGDNLDRIAVTLGQDMAPAAGKLLDFLNTMTESDAGEFQRQIQSVNDNLVEQLRLEKEFGKGAGDYYKGLVSESEKYQRIVVPLNATSEERLAIYRKIAQVGQEEAENMGLIARTEMSNLLMLDQHKKKILEIADAYIQANGGDPNKKKTPTGGGGKGAAKTEAQIMQDNLNVMALSQEAFEQQRLNTMQSFYDQRMALQGTMNEEEMAAYVAQETMKIANSKLTDDQKLAAMNALDKAVQKSSQNQIKTQLQFGAQIASYGEQMFADLATTMQNAGKESKAFAIGMKAMSMAQAGINSFLAFTSVLKDETIWPSWLRLPLAGTILAAGLAKQAAIASTPISAETGLTNYTVPDIRSNRNDSAPIMAQGGEEVSVTPRGESSSNLTNIDISISEQAIFSIVARGIKTGQINLNNKNVGRGVFAN